MVSKRRRTSASSLLGLLLLLLVMGFSFPGGVFFVSRSYSVGRGRVGSLPRPRGCVFIGGSVCSTGGVPIGCGVRVVFRFRSSRVFGK